MIAEGGAKGRPEGKRRGGWGGGRGGKAQRRGKTGVRTLKRLSWRTFLMAMSSTTSTGPAEPTFADDDDPEAADWCSPCPGVEEAASDDDVAASPPPAALDDAAGAGGRPAPLPSSSLLAPSTLTAVAEGRTSLAIKTTPNEPLPTTLQFV